MRAHEAGAVHGQGDAPAWLVVPDDVNDLLKELWPTTAGKDHDGVLRVGGLSVTEIAQRCGTPVYVLDELDFRARAAEFRDAFQAAFAPLAGADVYYAAKAFITAGLAGWLSQEGLRVDVCSGGELATVLRGGVAGADIGFHGNNKSDAEILRCLQAGVGRVIVDSLQEIDQVARIARAEGVQAPIMLRVRVGVEAHTHEYIATAHEDQKFGISLADGSAFEAARRAIASPDLELLGLHSHIGSQVFDTAGFELSARRTIGLHARLVNELGFICPEIDLGGGYGVAYTTGQDPQRPSLIARELAAIVARGCAEAGVAVPRVSVEPGRAIVGPSTFTLYTVGTVKSVTLDAGFSRLYVSVDGGMSDNIRTALYSADYSATLASRRSDAPPRLARVVGKHCESGDIIVKDEYLPADIQAGDLLAVPVTGAYCRSMASNYNHTPRPPVVAVRDGQIRTLLRRETEDDLLALDAG